MKCIHKLHFDISYTLDTLELNSRANAAKAKMSLSGMAELDKKKMAGMLSTGDTISDTENKLT